MDEGADSNRRSGCPISISLEMLGDRWTLLVIRDLMVRGYRTFKQFQGSDEGIASNILADRLRKLEDVGVITAETEEFDKRRVNYRLTEKGIDLAPVLLELLLWAARHENTAAPPDVIRKITNNREEFLAEVRRRWQEKDLRPVMPRFADLNTRQTEGAHIRGDSDESGTAKGTPVAAEAAGGVDI